MGSGEGVTEADWLSGAFSAGFGGVWSGVGSVGASDFVGGSGGSGAVTGAAGFDAAGVGEGAGAVLGLFSEGFATEVGLTAGAEIRPLERFWRSARRSLASGKGG